MKYDVLFGYKNQRVSEEWLEFSSDNVDDCVDFAKKYTNITDVEKPGYVYVWDNQSESVVDDSWIDLD